MRKSIRPPRYNALKKGRSHEFGLLLDAVMNERNKVKDIVTDNPEVLYETCWAGENVLHWLAIENHTEGIKLLRSLGSPIPEFALIHAVQHGHAETVILLLELGAELNEYISNTCSRCLKTNSFGVSAKKIRLIKSYFKQFGYAI
ncbi:ankyrin repeat domain-containing protein [Teredinibacter turnerae]|uniref:ankyrin repeat domain-containing protein n=1 Tax=Teredinibacter turnerae TaxID=2426 RepID=UPI0030CAC423